jgi:hypothetical protein
MFFVDAVERQVSWLPCGNFHASLSDTSSTHCCEHSLANKPSMRWLVTGAAARDDCHRVLCGLNIAPF